MTMRLERLPTAVAMALAVLFVAACTIRLRVDENETQSTASLARELDPMKAKLEQCRSVKYDQTDVLLECRKIWGEKRRHFLGQARGSSTRPNGVMASAGSLSPAPPKDESRLPSASPTIPAQRD